MSDGSLAENRVRLRCNVQNKRLQREKIKENSPGDSEAIF